MAQKWYQGVYRRNVVDMHIADWDESFLAQFNAKEYVSLIKRGQAGSAVVYAHSHVGHCYYPTQVGHQHASLKGRNILGEVVDECHHEGIDVVIYYSLIYDDYAYRKNPDWRIRRSDGVGLAENSRYGVCCPNSPYRDYAAAHVQEICRLFKSEGIRLDMTFWPAVCYCRHCRQRFADEVGGELPTIVNWEDPQWVAFQRCRERWLAEFAQYITNAIRAIQPNWSVEHQASTYTASWRLGVTTPMAQANDFLQGDFYGDMLQGSLARKLFHNLSPNLPYGFETSFSVSLNNHTAKKSYELLKAKASACLADAGAFVFIDAIDPVGTLNPMVYDRMGKVFEETKPYEPFIGGSLCQDVAVYLSTESKFNPEDNGKNAEGPNLSNTMPHIDAVLNTVKALIENHIPYGVITRCNLKELSRHKVIVLPNVLMLDAVEAEAFRAFVHAGGKLYASHTTSLVTPDGIRHPEFLLADVFGASYVGETQEAFTYIAPTQGHEALYCGYTAKHPLGLAQKQYLLQTLPGAEVLGTLTLPYTEPATPRHYSSIHSNPPGIATHYPAITLNHYGAGTAIYAAGALEADEIHRDTWINLLGLLNASWIFTADAPKPVEITAFHQPEKRRYIISAVNFQKELPNIPVEGITVRFKLGKPISKLLLLPDQTPWPYTEQDNCISFTMPRLETLQMFTLDY